jgi:hypothetical protein
VDTTTRPEARPETHGTMWADLFTAEAHARSAAHLVTRRALIYVECGLPVDAVLDALKLDAAAWATRIADYDEWRAANRAAARRIEAR